MHFPYKMLLGDAQVGRPYKGRIIMLGNTYRLSQPVQEIGNDCVVFPRIIILWEVIAV